jgi:hypothetical protein
VLMPKNLHYSLRSSFFNRGYLCLMALRLMFCDCNTCFVVMVTCSLSVPGWGNGVT